MWWLHQYWLGMYVYINKSFFFYCGKFFGVAKKKKKELDFLLHKFCKASL